MLQKLFSALVIVSLIISSVFTACKTDGEDETDTDTTKTEVNNNNNTATDNTEFTEQTYSVPSEIPYLQTKNDFIFDTFYPIGWSKDGKFAYIYEPADEATGFYFFTFEIKDTQTNKVIWTWKIDVKDEVYEGSLKKTWKKNKDKFTSILNENKIIQNNDFKLNQFPIIDKDNTYKMSENIKYQEDTYGFGFDVVSNAEFKLESKDNKSITVFKESFPDNMILNMSANAYFKSPFENRIAAIITSQIRGYEGPPHVIRINVVGCSLDFK